MRDSDSTKIVSVKEQECNSVILGPNIGAPGYVVEYEDGLKTWEPEEVFKEFFNHLRFTRRQPYKTTKGMTFGQALELMKKGEYVYRESWSKGNMLGLKNGTFLKVYGVKPTSLEPALAGVWTKSPDDLLATDWAVH